MNFIYFENTVDCSYPVGARFNGNFDYIREIAKTLYNIIDKNKNIALVCRGTSGCILAGAVGYILKKKGRSVTIVISRKSENTHGNNMDGYSKILKGAVPVVIDDFVSSGNTINEILIDLDECVDKKTYPFLCIANFWSMNKLEANRKKPGNKSYDVASRFDTIICNEAILDVY